MCIPFEHKYFAVYPEFAEVYDDLVRVFLLMSATVFIFSYNAVALAQGSLIPDPSTANQAIPDCKFTEGDVHFACIPQYIGYIVKLLLGFAGGFFLFGMMMAGYKYMFGSVTASGTEAGKKEIIARIVGFVIIVFSYLLVDTLINALTIY